MSFEIENENEVDALPAPVCGICETCLKGARMYKALPNVAVVHCRHTKTGGYFTFGTDIWRLTFPISAEDFFEGFEADLERRGVLKRQMIDGVH